MMGIRSKYAGFLPHPPPPRWGVVRSGLSEFLQLTNRSKSTGLLGLGREEKGGCYRQSRSMLEAPSLWLHNFSILHMS